MPRITLIHATPLAMAPIRSAFERLWPEARLNDLLDDGLTAALQEAPHTVVPRFVALARYAQLAQADAVLFSCSAFGDAIDAARSAVPLPMLKPNEAMLDDALAAGRRIVLLATFEPALASMAAEFEAARAATGSDATLYPVHVPGAFDALNAGDGERHDRLIADAVAALPPHDAVMLGQFSMARAAPAATACTAAPVLSSPGSAVQRLRRRLA